MLEKLLDLIFPKACLKCNKQGEGYICSSCFFELKTKIKLEKACGGLYEYLVYFDKYVDDTRKNILFMKFKEKAYFAEFYAELLTKNKNINSFLKTFDYIISVPMNVSKKQTRGYNQTELMARYISKKLNIKYEKDFLLKIRETKTQSLLSKKEREENIKRVFRVNNLANLLDKKIILVDDIYTTGATIKEISKILKQAGVKEICIIVIAKS